MYDPTRTESKRAKKGYSVVSCSFALGTKVIVHRPFDGTLTGTVQNRSYEREYKIWSLLILLDNNELDWLYEDEVTHASEH